MINIFRKIWICSIIFLTLKHYKQITVYNDLFTSGMVAVVVVAEQWCLSPTASQILFTTLGSALDGSHRSAQTPTDLQAELPNNTETLSSATDCGISVTCLAVCQKVSGPRTDQRRQGTCWHTHRKWAKTSCIKTSDWKTVLWEKLFMKILWKWITSYKNKINTVK